MMHAISLFRAIFLGLALFSSAFGPPAHASIGIITSTPGSARVPLGGSATVTITWNVPVNDGPVARSPSGVFRGGVDATLLGTVSTSLSKPAAAGTTAIITESLLVPADVIYRAHKMGLTSFTYFRDFEDEGTLSGQPGFVTINIVSSAAAGFSVSRLALAFDNGAPVRVLGMKESLQAEAEIGFSGSGLVQGVWEVAGPSSTSGQPVYRTLNPVRQYLTGGSPQTLRSPTLPTDSSGFYLVRFRITDPVPGFEQPVLRYFVSSGKPGEVLPVVPIGLVLPAHQSLLAPDDVFAWEPIRGARAYQLEVYEAAPQAGDSLPDLGGETATRVPALPATPPVTGMLVPGTQTKTTLSASARTHLPPGGRYLWRVLAIGGDGSVVGQSPVREIRLP